MGMYRFRYHGESVTTVRVSPPTNTVVACLLIVWLDVHSGWNTPPYRRVSRRPSTPNTQKDRLVPSVSALSWRSNSVPIMPFLFHWNPSRICTVRSIHARHLAADLHQGNRGDLQTTALDDWMQFPLSPLRSTSSLVHAETNKFGGWRSGILDTLFKVSSLNAAPSRAKYK
jgi:hypothetical protein